jgi:hypothetical protein
MSTIVRGLLVSGEFGIGGESTGWKILLDVGVEIQGLTEVEVNHKTTRFAQLRGSHVEATGELKFRSGIERQSCPVFEVESIQKID